MTIKLHDLAPAPGSKTKRTRVGRGEGSKGKTAGRGTKGTKARKNVPVTFEGGQMPIHMRLPKDVNTSEFVLAHGMMDSIVHRRDLKATLARILRLYSRAVPVQMPTARPTT